MHKNTVALFVIAVMLSLTLMACQDTKTLQENEQLRAQVAGLQKENGQLGNQLESATAARDALAQENDALKDGTKRRKVKPTASKASKRKRRQSQARRPS
jgi:cell division protein FtsB